ncbi:hypothetical protein PB01_07515 [Psychrobacillus glaciei]|uniref:Uncharacterized protein n=1 Tax=Psychrobacillus glaciei TaxID=2283160 RepID=A0A5J6SLW2_9BACI|nr:hypothetical protein [Psychrobacillus glaciei]QFF98692.1 hypothetical protein PB01_07515 [Psychrobacillus glaciei]
MEIIEAKDQIKKIEEYIQKVENYVADAFEKKVFKLYVLRENVTKITKELNEEEYRIGNRKLISKNILDLIRRKPTDEMHEMARKLFNQNKKRSALKY